MSLQWQVTRGLRLTLLVNAASTVLRAVVLAVLARLLSPSDYGLVAAAMVVILPVLHLMFLGIEQAGVLQAELRPGAMTSLFWLGAGATLLVIALLAAGANLAPISPALRSTTVLLSFILVGSLLALVPRILLRRELAFGRLAVAEMLSIILGFALPSLAGALAGYGVLALVFGYVGQTLVRGVASLLLCGDAMPGWCFDLQAVRPILAMGGRINKVAVLELPHAQIMPAFIGAALGTAPLGQFSQASSLVEAPIQLITVSMTQVVSTGFRIVRDELAQLRDACRRTVETASAISLPLCLGAAAAAVPLVDVVLGPQWTEAGRVMPWLALGAACTAIGRIFGVMTEAAGRLEEKFRIQLLVSALLVVMLFFVAGLGLRECAQAYSFSAFVYLAAQALLAARTMRVRLGEVLRWIAPGFICGTLIFASLTALEVLFPMQSQLAQLGLDIAACAAIFIGLYALVYPALWRELLSLALPGKRRDTR